jgi:Deacetylase PdaC
MLRILSRLSLVLLLGCTPQLQAETKTLEAKASDAQAAEVKASEAQNSSISAPDSQAAPMTYGRSETIARDKIASKTASKANGSRLLKVSLTQKNTTFTWGKPGGDRSEYREAKLSYPAVTGLADRELQDKIQESISLKSAFGRSLDEMEADFKESQWLTSLEYKANYNDNGLLSLTYSGMGMGAYPSSFVRHRSVNLADGSVLRAHDLFKTEGLGAIALQVDKQLQAAIKVKVAELENPDYKDIDPKIFSAHRFRIKHLNDFTLTSEGIIFHYQFGFPHAILVLEPKNDFLMTYDQLKAYVKPGSPLANIVR